MDRHGANRRAVAERIAETWRHKRVPVAYAATLVRDDGAADAARSLLVRLTPGLRANYRPAPETWRLACYLIRNSTVIARECGQSHEEDN